MDLPADAIRFFQDDHLVTPFRCGDGGLHAGRPRARDHDSSTHRGGRRCRPILLAAGHRIVNAADRTFAAVTTELTADAEPNLFPPTVAQLVYKVGVREMALGDADHVKAALRQRSLRHLWRDDAAGVEHGQINRAAYPGNPFELCRFRHIH